MSRRTNLGVLGAAVATAALCLPRVAAAADAGAAPTFTKDVAPIFQEKCEACHRPDSHGADVARHLRGRAAVGAVDRNARRRATDAAVAHRQDGRHPGVQERPVAERRADRHDPRVGRRRRAEGRSEGHARPRAVAGRSGLELREAVRADEPDLVMQVDAVDAEGRRAGHVVASGRGDRPHRAALGARDRNPPGRR